MLRAVRAAVGPGITSISPPASRMALTRTKPGSAMVGRPASETSIPSPVSVSFSTASVTLVFSLKSLRIKYSPVYE